MSLFPPIEPYNDLFLEVSDLHTIHVEEAGNPDGKPVVFVHGGPGGGIETIYRQYFDPEKWRIVLFDQRGCGKSTPFAELAENTTWDLVSDMEKIRDFLHIEKWVVFGGSWGSTLSLAYAQSHPGKVKGLILRGIFLLRHKEIQWFYQEGTSNIYPDAWENYIKPIDEGERDDFLSAYYKRLTSKNRDVCLEAAKENGWALEYVKNHGVCGRGVPASSYRMKKSCNILVKRIFLKHLQELNAITLYIRDGLILKINF